jgi:negative regulator of flagellin synthesis FlgM
MAMNITNQTTKPLAPTEPTGKVSRTSERQAAPTGSQTAGNEGVTLELTNTASYLGQVARGLSARPAFDQQKVDKLRSAIDSGQYQPNARSIAEKLSSTERLMGGGRP